MFLPAVQEMSFTNRMISDPESFKDYCVRTGQTRMGATPKYISVQTLSQLHNTLRNNDLMVFRLGISPGGKTSQFGLARFDNDWSDFFILDNELFSDLDVRTYIPTASYRDLYAFSLIPNFTETTLVNFAIASGLLKEALELDGLPSAAITGQSTYSFDFFPRKRTDGGWVHRSGQVEIDAAFTARRNGVDQLFLVEAKRGKFDTLAKTKLLYPYLAIKPSLPETMPVSLIYMRATPNDDSITYSVAEINSPPNEEPSPLLMKPKPIGRFKLKRPLLN